MKNSLFFERIIAFILCFQCLVLSVKTVYAQQSSQSLSPTLSELAIKPGQSTTVSFKYTNKGDPVIVKFKVEGLDKKSSEAIQFEILNNDLTLNEDLFLKNTASQDILLNIRVPSNTPEQDYYFNFVAESQPPPVEEGTGNIRAKSTLESPLLIIVTSNVQVEIKPKISIFDVVSHRKIDFLGKRLTLFDSFKKVPLVLVIENSGKNMIKPRGEIVVNGPLWLTSSYPIEAVIVLARSQKRIEVELPGGFIGNHKISANINLGEGTPTLFASNSYLTLPFKLSIFLLILLLIFACIKKVKK